MTDETTSIIQKYSQSLIMGIALAAMTAVVAYRGVDEEDAENILAACNTAATAAVEGKAVSVEMLTIYKTKLDIEK